MAPTARLYVPHLVADDSRDPLFDDIEKWRDEMGDDRDSMLIIAVAGAVAFGLIIGVLCLMMALNGS